MKQFKTIAEAHKFSVANGGFVYVESFGVWHVKAEELVDVAKDDGMRLATIEEIEKSVKTEEKKAKNRQRSTPETGRYGKRQNPSA